MDLLESTANELYASAVQAFPRTTRRQHSVDPIRIVEMHWTPFVGMKTLLVKARANNAGKDYQTLVLMKGIEYNKGDVELVADDGLTYNLEHVSAQNNDILVRCSCPDFYWRFNYYNHLDTSLYGRKRRKYESLGIGPPANPQELPGMCKHVMKTILALRDSGLIRG